MIRRPTAGETDEDLLRIQEAFYKAKNKPAVTDLKTAPKNKDHESKKEVSFESDIPTLGLSICGNIVERAADSLGTARPPDASTLTGFPEVFKVDESLASGGLKKKSGRSLFAQQMAKKRAEKPTPLLEPERIIPSGTSEAVDKMDTDESVVPSSTILETSRVLDDRDVKVIHEENVQKLSSMSMAEIKEERSELMSSVDPKTLEFLKSLRSKKRSADVEAKPEAPEEKAAKLGGEEIEEVEKALPVDVEEARSKFVHMSEVEYEKLKWITDLPAPEAKPQTGSNQARFDFQGNLLSAADKDLPVTKGLHHHGEEPDKPGYSLAELFTLARSTFAAQKIVGLNVLGEIFRKANAGYFDGVFEQNIVEQVLDSGALFLLRFGLDENADGVVPAAVNALHGLIVNEFDEICLDRAFGPAELSYQPSLPSGVEMDDYSKMEVAEEGGETSLKDSELLRLDVVKALIRMNIMPRLRYILHKIRPSPPTVIQCLELLTRIARHSLQACHEIANTPGLMEVIVENFLPCTAFSSTVPAAQLKNVYGVPLRHALKLVRVLACRSRSLALKIHTEHNIMDAVSTYVSFDPSEMGLPLKEALRLSLESYRVWTVLLMYGLADKEFLSLYPILMRQLVYYEWKVSVNVAVSENEFNYDLGSSLIGLFEVAVYVASSRNTILRTPGLLGRHSVPEISFEHLSSVYMTAKTLTQKWTAETLLDGEAISFSGWKLIGAAYRLITAIMSQNLITGIAEVEKGLKAIEEVMEGLTKFLSSTRIRGVINQLTKILEELKTRNPGTLRDAKNLPSLGAVRWTGDHVGGKGLVPPLLADVSPIFFWDSFCRFLSFVVTAHVGVNIQALKQVFEDASLKSFAESFCRIAGRSSNEWFFRMVTKSMFHCVRISRRMGRTEGLSLDVALNLVSQVQPGQQYFLKFLTDEVLFEPENFSNVEGSCKIDPALWHSALGSLREIRSLFTSLLVDSNAEKSQQLASGRTYNIDTMTVTNSGQSVVPQDWIFLPIWAIHSSSIDMGSKYTTFRSLYPDDRAAHAIGLNLRWNYLVDASCPAFALKTSPGTIYCRLALVFLAGDSYFLDGQVKPHLEGVVRQLLERDLNLDKPVPGLTSILDFFSEIVEQFTAVSYGDVLFQNFILLAMQSRHDAALRRLVWGEKNAALSLFRLKETDLFMPFESLISRKDDDGELLRCYREALITGLVRRDRQPVLYRIAKFHLKPSR